MPDATIRTALLITVAVASAGGLVELVLAGHFADVVQWIPIVTLGLMSVVALVLVFRPTTWLVTSWRWLMASAIVFALIGMWAHYAGNLSDADVDRPFSSTLGRLWDALFGGNPLLAPGFLAFVAAIGLIAVARWDGSSSAGDEAPRQHR